MVERNAGSGRVGVRYALHCVGSLRALLIADEDRLRSR